MLSSSGERPPCMHRIFSSTMAATGKQLKQSVNVFHSLILYLRLPVRGEKKERGGGVVSESSARGGWVDKFRVTLTFVIKAIDSID